MNDNQQRSFDRAQRQYDNQMPPEDNSPECEVCDGEGVIHSMTNCCGTSFVEPGWPDIDICLRCKEHAEPAECPYCDGKGVVQKKESPDEMPYEPRERIDEN